MTTGLQIIKSAMLKIGALTKTETPSSDEAQDALRSLNEMIASWVNDGMLIIARTKETFTLQGGVREYSYGYLGATSSGGSFSSGFSSGFDIETVTAEDFVGERPNKILAAYVTVGNTDYALSIINDIPMFLIAYKEIAGIPEYLNFNNGYPVANITLYPTPAAAYPITLMTEKQFSNITLSGEVNLPSGWTRALIYNLAMELAPEYNQPVTPEIAQIAKESKGSIKKAIMRNRPLDAFPQTLRSYNIYSGWDQ